MVMISERYQPNPDWYNEHEDLRCCCGTVAAPCWFCESLVLCSACDELTHGELYGHACCHDFDCHRVIEQRVYLAGEK